MWAWSKNFRACYAQLISYAPTTSNIFLRLCSGKLEPALEVLLLLNRLYNQSLAHLSRRTLRSALAQAVSSIIILQHFSIIDINRLANIIVPLVTTISISVSISSFPISRFSFLRS